MKLIYICSPYRAYNPEEMEKNKQAALTACEEAYKLGRLAGERFVPITPIVNFPYLNENDPQERAQAVKLGLTLLSKCDELWVAGDRISEGMRGEIRAAVRMEKPVYSMGLEQQTIQAVINGMEPLLDYKCCLKNSDNKDYTGQLLVLKASTLAPGAKEPQNQLWIAENGFGVSPTASGRAVYAKCLYDGEEARWNRSDFYGIADGRRIPVWAKEKLLELQEQNNDDEMEDMEE